MAEVVHQMAVAVVSGQHENPEDLHPGRTGEENEEDAVSSSSRELEATLCSRPYTAPEWDFEAFYWRERKKRKTSLRGQLWVIHPHPLRIVFRLYRLNKDGR